MLQVVGQTQYVEGVLQGVAGIDTVCIGEIFKGRTGINPGCSKTKQFCQDEAGETRKDGITG